MTVPPRQFVPPLDFRTPIVDPKTGQPTLQFIQLWQQTQGNESNTNSQIATIQAEVDAAEVDIVALQAAAVPPGGSTGEVLTKDSGADYDMSWQPGGGGGGGGGGLPFKGALVYRTTDLTAQDYTTAAIINWQAEEYDEGGWYNVGTSASRLVVPSGFDRVKLKGQIALDLLTTGNGVSLAVLKNGSVAYTGVPRLLAGADGFTTAIFNVSSPALTVVAGDYFEVRVQVSADTSVTFAASASWFAIEAVQDGGGGGTGGIWAPLVSGALPGPELIANGAGECIMVQIG